MSIIPPVVRNLWRGGNLHLGRSCALIFVSVNIVACSARQSPAPQPSKVPLLRSQAVGVASWYGPGFHGHRTSSGEIYDQNELTAASVLFPLQTRLLVTNLRNGRVVEVTVNDHGPYVKGRQLDLSKKAARVLGMLGPGTAHVRMEVLHAPAGGPPLGQRYFVQVGSFADVGNARRMRRKFADSYSDVHVIRASAGDSYYYRVRMGAFMSRRAAEQRAIVISGSGVPVVIVSE